MAGSLGYGYRQVESPTGEKEERHPRRGREPAERRDRALLAARGAGGRRRARVPRRRRARDPLVHEPRATAPPDPACPRRPAAAEKSRHPRRSLRRRRRTTSRTRPRTRAPTASCGTFGARRDQAPGQQGARRHRGHAGRRRACPPGAYRCGSPWTAARIAQRFELVEGPARRRHGRRSPRAVHVGEAGPRSPRARARRGARGCATCARRPRRGRAGGDARRSRRRRRRSRAR